MPPSPSPGYVFPPFRLEPAERRLTADGLPLKLGGRAFETLLALVERRGRTVPKLELMELVWPRLVVEENNLQVQVATLRKLLGHHAIGTVPGRGYRFTLPVTVEGGAAPEPAPAPPSAVDDRPAAAAAAPTAAPPGRPPPRRADPLFGRQADVDTILARLGRWRVVTIAGAGGIGKTRVAEAVATVAAADFADGVWWVELASLADPALVPTAIARAIGLPLTEGDDTLRNVVARVGDRAMLIVLDNAEHLLDGVAAFVEAAIAATPRLRVLLTSQEVLRAPEEAVHRLGTLDLPADDSAAAVAASGAGALLCARIVGRAAMFRPDAAGAAAAAEICRRLDGIPLAIELAAARVPLLGLEGVRARLDQRFRMLTAGARVVLRRHQTLRAALDWSFGLLDEETRIVLRRLGVFAGGFTLEAAQRVGADDARIDAWDVLEHLGALVDKSLVLAEGEPIPRYRMLETTRLFALEKLAEADETEIATRRHAEALVAQMAYFVAPATRFRSTPADRAAAAAELDNTRAALDWATGRPDDASLVLQVAAASLYPFHFADGIGEGFERIASFRHRVPATTDGESDAESAVPLRVRAAYLLALARAGTQMARSESLDAALRAEPLYGRLGDDGGRFCALTYALAIGARVDIPVDGDALIAAAARLSCDAFPATMRSNFEWARHRWLLRQDRPAEALAHARRQDALLREGGATEVANSARAANVGYCELACGRPEAAESLGREAMTRLVSSDRGQGHVLDAWAMAVAVQGRFDEALALARRAHADLETSGDAFMLLDGLAWIAAAEGRPRDAVLTMARADAEYAARRFLRWPLSVDWRRRTEAALAGLSTEDRACWTREAADLPRDVALRHALGAAAAPTVQDGDVAAGT